MNPCSLLIGLALFSPTPLGESGHQGNAVFQFALSEGLKADSREIKLPPPTFRDEMSADEQTAALRQIAGSDRAVQEMKSDSISAPHKLFLKDTKTNSHIIRSGDLYFTLRVDLESIQPKEAFKSFRSRPMEVGNIRFESKILAPEELGPATENQWSLRETARLLDRIVVVSTDQIVASRTRDSLVFAARTAPRVGQGGASSNQWQSLTIKGNSESLGAPQLYLGGVGYTKLSRLKGEPNILFVESHFAYAEPLAWFDGAPILRSKFGLIAQDQIRKLRAELKKSGQNSEPKR